MNTKEPKDATLLAARLALAYPSLSAYSAATLAEQLCAIERMQRRHAERCCLGEDGGYVKRYPAPRVSGGRAVVAHDPDAEARAEKRVERAVHAWRDRVQELTRQVGKSAAIELQGDPRGPVLLLRLPGETEAKAV